MKSSLLSLLLVAALFSTGTIQAAETVTRVADINPGSRGSYPSYLTVFDGQLYFRGNTGLNNVELWRFDGSNATLAAEINPGSEGSTPSYLVAFNGALYFDAFRSGVGYRLWRFDGTSATAISTTQFSSTGSWKPVEYQSGLWFRSSRGMSRFDGTGFSELVQPPYAATDPVVFGTSLYYGASDTANGTELWRFNGSSQARVAQINAGSGSAYPDHFVVYRGVLYFSAYDGVHGYELWRYTGAAAPTMIEINPGAGGSEPINMAVFADRLFFSADDGIHGYELFRYDGTNVTLAADINKNPVYEEGGDRLSDSSPQQLLVLSNRLYFAAYDGTNRGVWSYDGTNATLLGGGSLNEVNELVLFQNTVYFDADDGVYGRELWKIDPEPGKRLEISTGAGEFQIELTEAETGSYIIQGTTDFLKWDPLYTNRPVDGVLRFVDPSNPAGRIYRAVRAVP